jgi:hypothetical protein
MKAFGERSTIGFVTGLADGNAVGDMPYSQATGASVVAIDLGSVSADLGFAGTDTRTPMGRRNYYPLAFSATATDQRS